MSRLGTNNYVTNNPCTSYCGLWCRGFEDAYEKQKESSPEPTAAGRKRKLTAKGKGRAQDPSIARAMHILATSRQAGGGLDDVDV